METKELQKETSELTLKVFTDLCEGVKNRMTKVEDPKKAADLFIKGIAEDLESFNEDHAISLSVQRTHAKKFVNERRYVNFRQDQGKKNLICAVGTEYLNFQIALLE